jgi:hypothetical protein
MELQRIYDQYNLPSNKCRLSLRTRNRYVRSCSVSLQMSLLCKVIFHMIEECRHVGGRSSYALIRPHSDHFNGFTLAGRGLVLCALFVRSSCSSPFPVPHAAPSATPSELSHSVMPLFTSSMLDHAGFPQLLPLGQYSGVGRHV